jgi:cytochrome c oxidase subunit 4
MTSHQRPERRTLYLIYVTLLVLLTLSAIGAKVPMSGGLHDLIAYSISIAKTALIVAIFMEVRYDKGITRVFAGAGLVWLALFFLLIFSDYLTRP